MRLGDEGFKTWRRTVMIRSLWREIAFLVFASGFVGALMSSSASAGLVTWTTLGQSS
jgi:hypothetical protein